MALFGEMIGTGILGAIACYPISNFIIRSGSGFIWFHPIVYF